ncbi:hypothetical protein [Nocardia sp. NPDC051750]|uniref:hypothetical protein n=1 Tax=Nocardia sp. NPDC051750 TaxID=3364325 RepID=UPI00378A1878
MASDNPDEWWQHAPEGQQNKNSPSGQWQQGYQSQGGQQSPAAPWGQTAGQVPQPPPPQGAWEVPPLGSGGQGGPPRNNGPLIAVLAVVVVLVLVGVVGMVLLRSGGSQENTASATSAATGTTDATTTSATSTTTTSAPAPAPGTPAFEEGLTPVVLRGSTFQDGEDTYTMAFKDWPFAFRTPGSWGCMKGSVDKIPDAQAWGCVDEGDSSAGQRVNLILRKCPATCDPATRVQFDNDWFDKDGAAEQFDPNTSYVETASNDKGKYTIDLSRYIAAEQGGEPVWQLGVYVESPSATKDAVLKTLNDILTQTQ